MFVINKTKWHLKFVPVGSHQLTRSDGTLTIGMTDANTHFIYLSDKLYGDLLEHVLCHELCHCVCFSYNISLPIETEEWLCNFMADYGKEIIYLLDDLLQNLLVVSA